MMCATTPARVAQASLLHDVHEFLKTDSVLETSKISNDCLHMVLLDTAAN